MIKAFQMTAADYLPVNPVLTQPNALQSSRQPVQGKLRNVLILTHSISNSSVVIHNFGSKHAISSLEVTLANPRLLLSLCGVALLSDTILCFPSTSFTGAWSYSHQWHWLFAESDFNLAFESLGQFPLFSSASRINKKNPVSVKKMSSRIF